MITYKDAGVDVERGYEAVSLMKKHVKRTMNENVLGGLGSFGGFYTLENEKMEKPVLVAGTDGVGTKLKFAFILDKHDTVGIDCVAMCVNDVICQGARPLFFLDYIASGRMEPEKIAEIVAGVSEGCVQSSCALIGGETAEMPGFYQEGEYDMAGFCVGIVDRDKSINGSKVKEGDVLIGLASSGLHSNGFSLVRKLILNGKYDLEKVYDGMDKPLGEAILTPTRIYVKTIMSLTGKLDVHGIANITGGGFIENIPRCIPDDNLAAEIKLGSWSVPPLFELLRKEGQLDDKAIYNTFNMGIGMVVALSPEDADKAIAICEEAGDKAYRIGSIVKREGGEKLVLR
ncbi:MAG: phosphoribosylformylglycinamidine cyclo-ligase [Eubacteriales bacterium]|nr:phosphoribosylformylglycinamidine cyclo-ligase [Eubacteriales bacterium]MDD3880918.1 phosphoribosylformylglycinamidine cyclo-ligase [Eubacteriales bacterium]